MKRINSKFSLPALLALLALQSGCAIVMDRVTGKMAGNLSSAILNQEDPETVRDGAPAYLLLMDSMIEGNPESASALGSAANLYAAYGAVFVEDPERAKRLDVQDKARRDFHAGRCARPAAVSRLPLVRCRSGPLFERGPAVTFFGHSRLPFELDQMGLDGAECERPEMLGGIGVGLGDQVPWAGGFAAGL